MKWDLNRKSCLILPRNQDFAVPVCVDCESVVEKKVVIVFCNVLKISKEILEKFVMTMEVC